MNRKIVKYLLTAVATLLVAAGCKNFYQQQIDEGNIISKDLNLPVNYRLADDPQVVLNIPSPENVKASKGVSNTEIKVSWSKISYEGKEVSDYYVYRSTDNKTFMRLQDVDSPKASNEFTDVIGDSADKVKPGTVYYYAVKAVITDEKGTKHTSLLSFRDQGYLLSLPENIKATFRTYDDKIVVSWDKALGANYYMVARLDTKDESVNEDTNVYKYAIRGTEFTDMRNDLGGDRFAGETYYYKVRAHYDSYNKTDWSKAYGGSILSPGAPAKIKGIQVSKGVKSDCIQLSWLKDESAEDYLIYREESPEGEFTEPLSVKVSTNEFEDKDIVYGKTYYYRISATNSSGAGRLSDFDKFAHQGYSLSAPAKADALRGFLDEESLIVLWDTVKGAAKYGLWQSGPYDSPIENYNSFEDDGSISADFSAGWTRLHTAESYLLSNKFDIPMISDGKYYYYRIVSLHNDYAVLAEDDAYDYSTDPAFMTDIEDFKGKSVIVELSNERTMPILGVISYAGKKDKAFLNKVPLKVELTSEVSDSVFDLYANFIDVSVKKKCMYGYEEGVEYDDLPNDSIRNKTSSFVGKSHKVNTQFFDLSTKAIKAKYAELEDPYQDFDASGNVILAPEFECFSYRWWDREAWKDLVRQKNFNMLRAVESEYSVVCKWKNAPTDFGVQTESAVEKGYPAISDKKFASLCIWLKEVAVNRIWELRYPEIQNDGGAGNLIAVLTANREYPGANGGKIGWNAKVDSNIFVPAGVGSLWITNYSDWPGFCFNLKKALNLNIKIAEKDNIWLAGTAEVTTPLYSGLFSMNYRAWLAISSWKGYLSGSTLSVQQQNSGSVDYKGDESFQLYNEHQIKSSGGEPWLEGHQTGKYFSNINLYYKYGYYDWDDLYVVDNYGPYMDYGYED